MRRGAIFGVLLAAIVAIPAGAVTTVVYKGKTSQGLTARLVVNDGTLDRVYFRWVGKCRNKRFVWRDRTWYLNRPEGPIERNGDAFSDGGRIVVRYKDGTRAIHTSRMSGTFGPNNTATGEMWETVRFYGKHGKRRDFCRTGLIHFSASA
jgi:hypothetical protein